MEQHSMQPQLLIIVMKELSKELQLRRIQKNKQIYFSKTLKLGQGAFGEVFLGFDETAHTPFACKIISLEKINAHSNQDSIIKKIKDEIVNMQIARNEHIVEFYQAKTSDRNIYILCQYCNGDNLDRFLKSRGYLTESEALGYFKEILQGFYNLRERNIVHRDMKPANLLMHNYSLKIADLGFSKSIDNHEQLLQSVVGSPLYMSPQIFEHKKYTEKTDIWSVGAIFYEMLYGRNPFSGCNNLMELKERVKKQIVFPSYPYVTQHTKSIIRRIMVVEQKDRIDWEFLFNQFLLKPHQIPVPVMPHGGFYSMSMPLYEYFRSSYFIESQQHLHKVLKAVSICSQEQLAKLYPFFETSQQFFSHTYFCTVNKALIDEYFAFFIQQRNQIAYLMVLAQKFAQLMATHNNQQLSVFVYCIYMLVYRLAITVIDDMVSQDKLLHLPNLKYQLVFNKFCHEKFLLILLGKDRERIQTELGVFSPYFRAMLSGLGQSNPQLLGMIQTDLSGIYSSEQGDRRVIRFFLKNYFKKVHNLLKDTIAQQKGGQMVNEDEQQEMEGEHVLPPIQVTICRLIGEYLNNQSLFDLKALSSNLKLPSFHSATFRKNLSQILYDCQTTLHEGVLSQLWQGKPFEEESIVSFMSKEIKWNSIFLPSLQ